MQGATQHKPLQNESLLDRLLRTIVGVILLAIAYNIGVIGMGSAIGFLVGIYLIITAFIGMDFIYRALGVRTCGTSKRNQCGTFAYQIDAVLNKVHPEPGYEDKPSEPAAVHEPEESSKPRHDK